MKAKIFTLMRVVISLSFIAFLLWSVRDKWVEILEILKNIDTSLLVLGGALFIASLVIVSWRLRSLLNAQGLKLRYKEAISLTFIGYFFNNFLPTAMGGDLVKAYYASKNTENKVGCFATVFMDRLVGIFSLFAIAGVAALFAHSQAATGAMAKSIFGILGLLIVFFFLLWNKLLARKIFLPLFNIGSRFSFIKRLDIAGRLRRAYDTVNSFKDKKGLLLRMFAVSVIAQLVCFSAVYFWLKGMASPVPMRIVLMTMPLVAIICVLPSINGLGIREYAMVLLFGSYAGKENAFALSLVWLFMLYVVSIIGGLNYAFSSQYKLGGIK